MSRPVVDVAAPDAAEQVASALRTGGAVVLPTDTVYGLAVLPVLPGATQRLCSLKDRSDAQPVAVLVADVAQALELSEPPTATVSAWMDACWPGPLTLVLRRSERARSLDLGGDPDTIGIRCPDHALLRAVASMVGPVATTSANRHGEPTPPTALEAADGLTGPVALVVDGGPSGAVASTVVDATAEPWRVVRLGALTEERLRQVAR